MVQKYHEYVFRVCLNGLPLLVEPETGPSGIAPPALAGVLASILVGLKPDALEDILRGEEDLSNCVAQLKNRTPAKLGQYFHAMWADSDLNRASAG